MAGTASRLNNLFASDASDSGSLSYTRPTPPKPVPKATPAPTPPQRDEIIFSTGAHLYVLREGKFKALRDDQIGCVLLGCLTAYKLLLYDASKATLCMVVLDHSFALSLLPQNYVNFSAAGEMYSLKLPSAEAAERLLIYLALSKAHVAYHSGGSPEDAAQDLLLGAGSKKISEGDTAGLTFTAWQMTENPKQKPNSVITATPEIQGEELFKVVVRGGSAPIKGMDAGIDGMGKGGKRLLFLYQENTEKLLVVQVSVSKVKYAEAGDTAGFAVSHATISTAAVATSNSKVSVQPQPTVGVPEKDDVKGRMMRLSQAGSGPNLTQPQVATATLGSQVALHARQRSNSGIEVEEVAVGFGLIESSTAAKEQPRNPMAYQGHSIPDAPQANVPLQTQHRQSMPPQQPRRQQQQQQLTSQFVHATHMGAVATSTQNFAVIPTSEVRGAYQPGPRAIQKQQQMHHDAYSNNDIVDTPTTDTSRYPYANLDRLIDLREISNRTETMVRDIAKHVEKFMNSPMGVFQTSVRNKRTMKAEDEMLIDSLQRLITENMDLREKVEESDSKLGKLQIELREAREDVNKILREQQKAMLETNRAARLEIAETTALRDEIDSLKRQIKGMGNEEEIKIEKATRSMTTMINKLQEKNTRMENALTSAQTKVEEYENHISDLQEELQASIQKMHQSEQLENENISHLQRSCNTLRIELESVKSELAKSQEQCTAIQKAPHAESAVTPDIVLNLKAKCDELEKKIELQCGQSFESGYEKCAQENNDIVVKQIKSIMKAYFKKLKLQVSSQENISKEGFLELSRSIIKELTLKICERGFRDQRND